MTALEEPGSSGEAADPGPPGDELEGWLSDLRTDVAAAPSAWIGDEAAQDGAPGPGPRPSRSSTPGPHLGRSSTPDPDPGRSATGTGAPGRSGGGRHRAED
ncbi:hypothetical protein [Nucisporomicrobium flavum]|uniref:hypothetical protein n=1 Tax=Nucisporomicrobium flavum TaxID=2785915 RepID=UPI0018F4898F|nr:hypothetical protein [Nucisporomicrobium flavum]